MSSDEEAIDDRLFIRVCDLGAENRGVSIRSAVVARRLDDDDEETMPGPMVLLDLTNLPCPCGPVVVELLTADAPRTNGLAALIVECMVSSKSLPNGVSSSEPRRARFVACRGDDTCDSSLTTPRDAANDPDEFTADDRLVW